MRRWFMTFPVDILCYYTIMSLYSSLDHGPGFPVHYLPSPQQSIRKDPSLMGLNYQQDGYYRVQFMMECQKKYKDN